MQALDEQKVGKRSPALIRLVGDGSFGLQCQGCGRLGCRGLGVRGFGIRVAHFTGQCKTKWLELSYHSGPTFCSTNRETKYLA